MTGARVPAGLVTQSGSVTCEVASNGGFVLVRLPLLVDDHDADVTVVSHYRLDGFLGREVEWPLTPGMETTLTMRVPAEQFRDGEILHLEVRSAGGSSASRPVWSGRYVIVWDGSTPGLEPVEAPLR